MAKLWGGRFTKNTDAFAEGFHSSISFDSRMYKQDITGSIAHAKMLAKQGILSNEDSEAIVNLSLIHISKVLPYLIILLSFSIFYNYISFCINMQYLL